MDTQHQDDVLDILNRFFEGEFGISQGWVVLFLDILKTHIPLR